MAAGNLAVQNHWSALLGSGPGASAVRRAGLGKALAGHRAGGVFLVEEPVPLLLAIAPNRLRLLLTITAVPGCGAISSGRLRG